MIPYIDMHCDTLMWAYREKEKSVYRLPHLMVDAERLKQGGNLAQMFAIFMLPEGMRTRMGAGFPEDKEYINTCLQIFRQTLQEHPELIREVRNLADYEYNVQNGKISGILTIEDGRWVNGCFENLEWLYQEGVRMMALTWNYQNCFGFPNSEDGEVMQKGLTNFGKEAVERMNEMGMIIDVSHLSDGGFWDVVQLTKKPFVASHSNCRSLSPHRRNLTDEMIRALAEKGGVMGLNFCGAFLNQDIACEESRIPKMISHLKHMIHVGGEDVAGIGTDFDGTGGEFDIASCDKMQILFESLEHNGFTARQIEKIAYKNVERVLRENL